MVMGVIKYVQDVLHLHDEETAHKKKKKKKKKVSKKPDYPHRDYRGIDGVVDDAESGN